MQREAKFPKPNISLRKLKIKNDTITEDNTRKPFIILLFPSEPLCAFFLNKIHSTSPVNIKSKELKNSVTTIRAIENDNACTIGDPMGAMGILSQG